MEIVGPPLDPVPASSKYALFKLNVSAQESGTVVVSLGIKPTGSRWDEVDLRSRFQFSQQTMPRSEDDLLLLAIKVLEQTLMRDE